MLEAYQGQLDDLGELVARMCGKTADALRDATEALLTAALALRPIRTTTCWTTCKQELLGAVLNTNWLHGVEPAVDLALLGRFYERFADHAVAIGRLVILLVSGYNVGGDTTRHLLDWAPRSAGAAASPHSGPPNYPKRPEM